MKRPAPQHQHYGTFGLGDREKFFFQLAFEPFGDENLAASEEEALSWGSFEIWVSGRNLCRHLVGVEESRAVHWCLLPLMEWFTEHWDFIFHEQRLPARNAGENAWASLTETNSPFALERGGEWDFQTATKNSEWIGRHSLFSAREGGLFPDIVIRRYWGDVEISWGDEAPAGAPDGFRFVESAGAVRLPPALVAEPMHGVLSVAVEALLKTLPKSRRLERLQEKLAGLKASELQTRRVAILAGLGEKAKEWTTRWTKLQEELTKEFSSAKQTLNRLFGPPQNCDLFVPGSCQGALMFGTVSPTLSERDVLFLARRLVQHSTTAKGEDKLEPHAPHRPPKSRGGPPWLEGYQLAQEWTETSGLAQGAEECIDIEKHLKSWGVAVDEAELADEYIGGVAVACEKCTPLILLNSSNRRNQFPSGRRFSLAHEFCHLLYDRMVGKELALVSGPWAPIEVEKRANAFAAMLLMPDRLVEQAFDAVASRPSQPTFENLVDAAKRLGVSADALGHHLANRGWISEGYRDYLLEHLQNR